MFDLICTKSVTNEAQISFTGRLLSLINPYSLSRFSSEPPTVRPGIIQTVVRSFSGSLNLQTRFIQRMFGAQLLRVMSQITPGRSHGRGRSLSLINRSPLSFVLKNAKIPPFRAKVPLIFQPYRKLQYWSSTSPGLEVFFCFLTSVVLFF